MKLIIFIFALTFSGNIFAKCFEDIDKFKGVELHWCGAWGTGGIMLGALNGVDPIPYLSKINGQTNIFIRLRIEQQNFSFIQKDNELIFVTDSGEKLTLKASSASQKDVKSDTAVGVQATEFSDYPITIEQFKLLASAKQVDFAAYTEKGRFERTLKKPQLKIYNEFLNDVVGANK